MIYISRTNGEQTFLDFSDATDADIAALRAGQLIVMTVTSLSNDKVRTQYDLPRSIGLWRRELYEAKQRERAGAGPSIAPA